MLVGDVGLGICWLDMCRYLLGCWVGYMLVGDVRLGICWLDMCGYWIGYIGLGIFWFGMLDWVYVGRIGNSFGVSIVRVYVGMFGWGN